MLKLLKAIFLPRQEKAYLKAKTKWLTFTYQKSPYTYYRMPYGEIPYGLEVEIMMGDPSKDEYVYVHAQVPKPDEMYQPVYGWTQMENLELL